VTDPVRLPLSPETRVIAIDHFGNLITNVRPPLPKGFALEFAGKKITRLVSHYAEAPDGRPCLIIGSSGRVEIFIKQGSAAAWLL